MFFLRFLCTALISVFTVQSNSIPVITTCFYIEIILLWLLKSCQDWRGASRGASRCVKTLQALPLKASREGSTEGSRVQGPASKLLLQATTPKTGSTAQLLKQIDTPEGTA